MKLPNVEPTSYLRIFSCTMTAGLYLALCLLPLVFYVNPYLPMSWRNAAAIAAYLLPLYGTIFGLVITLLLFVLQPFLVTPLAHRYWDPVLLARLLLLVLLVAGVIYYANTSYVLFLISPIQRSHMVRAGLGLTILFGLTLIVHALERYFRKQRTAARWVLLLLVFVTPYFLVRQRRQSHAPLRRHALRLDVAASGDPVVFLAIDSLNLTDLRPAAASGSLPGFARLMQDGVAAPLRPIRPTTPSVTFTTLATGKLPFRHGIAGDYVFRLEGMPHVFQIPPRFLFFRKLIPIGLLDAVPVGRYQRHALTFWELLERTGDTIGVANWPASHPATKVNGFMITDRFLAPSFDEGELLAGSTWPVEPARDAFQHRIVPTDTKAPELAQLFPEALPLSEEGKPAAKLRMLLREGRASDLTILEAVQRFRSNRHPVLQSARLPGLGIAERFFLRYHRPEAFGNVTQTERKQYGRVIARYLSFIDDVIAKVLADLPANGTLVVVSPTGMEPATFLERILGLTGDFQASGSRRRLPSGSLLMLGKNIRKGIELPPQRITDITPTLLYLQGLPTARDMDGDPIYEAFTEEYKSRMPLSTIESYEAAIIVPAEDDGRSQ